ncbi:MAG: MFS transporter [Bryobacteraceae bacterium]
MATTAPSAPAAVSKLTPNQIRGFIAAWGGWLLDGMDSFIYALVLVPALKEILPNSGIEPTAANIGYYGGLLFALFLIGWGLAVFWGPISDRFGRMRTLMITVLFFSLFTFLSAFAQTVWSLAIYRLLAGAGIGGEWSVGATFVSEEWPEDRRKQGAGLMHTGYYVGFFVAAIANYFVGAHYGWRWMFALGGFPALLVGMFYSSVQEPEKWKKKKEELGGKLTLMSSIRGPFASAYRRRTILNCVYMVVSITGLWAGSSYVPVAVTQLATRAGHTAVETAQLSSYATAILSIGTILGALITPWMCEKFGRRKALGAFFALMFAIIILAFGVVFYMPGDVIPLFMTCLFFLGLGGGNFAVYSLWLPEQYATEIRASAFAIVTSGTRFIGAGISFLVGAGVSYFGTIGTPVALTSIAFAIGLLLLPLGYETKGHELPK